MVFSASGRTITFAGFLKAYVESIDDQAGGEADDAESRLPQLEQGQRVDAKELTADGHTTSPPARYTEASLIKALEDLGIGRPSTYSSIIKTIQDRGYVHKKGSALVPSWVAFAVIGLLEQHFGRLVDYGFTAAMEDELDEIASGNERRTNWLNNFYFGGDHGVADSIARSGGLKKLVGVNLEGIDAREVNSIKLFDDEEGRPVYVRVGKNGPYLERMITGDDGEPTPQRANLKDELTPDELTLELAEKAFATPQEGRSLGVDPATGHEVVAKDGRYGPYVTEVLPAPPDEPEGDAGTPAKKGKKPTGPKPRTGSLLRTMDLETVTLEDALRLLVASACRRGRSEHERGDHRAERPIRPIPQAWHRLSLPGDRRADVRHHPRRGAEDLLGAETPWWTRSFGTATARAGQRPRNGEADGDQGRPVRALRHRR